MRFRSPAGPHDPEKTTLLFLGRMTDPTGTAVPVK